jgi:four helix bundle protein
MQDFRNLRVWKIAHELVLAIYKATRSFPKAEVYGLTQQMRRAAVSIAANIAEGCGRGGDADFARFLQIAMGSATELEYQLLLSRDLEYLPVKEHRELEEGVIGVKQMLSSFIRTLKVTG